MNHPLALLLLTLPTTLFADELPPCPLQIDDPTAACDISPTLADHGPSCLDGRLDVCDSLSLRILHHYELGIYTIDPAAAPLMQHGCNEGVASSCTVLGSLRFYGHGIEQDPLETPALYEKACQSGQHHGCQFLGLLYLHGTGGLDMDQSHARTLFQETCAQGDQKGCVLFASTYLYGQGVEKSVDEGRRLLQIECDADVPLGCLYLACQAGDDDYCDAD